MRKRNDPMEFLRDKRVIFFLACVIISILCIASFGIQEGLDLKGGSIIQLQLEHSVDKSTMDTVTKVLDKRLNLYGISDVKVRQSGNQQVIVEMAGATPEEVEKLIGNPGVFEAKIDNQTVITGSDISNVEMYQVTGQSWRVPFKLTTQGAKKFAAAAKDKSGHEVWMYLDGKPVDKNPPKLSADLASGEPATEIEVSGSGIDQKDANSKANDIYTVLKTGSLPVKVSVIGSDTVSAELGQQFIEGTAIAAVLAILAISVLIFFRYRKPILVIPILITTLSEVVIVLGIASIIHWNIDLAAIAGLMASVGTGVDDQIIILDEVLAHKGNSNKKNRRRTRTQMNVKKAFFIIFASAGTLIAAMLPLSYIGFARGASGIGTISGFAFTTILGVLVGVFITRPAFAKFVEIFVK
ncbi:preprotein translocase subunit SecD [Methanobrevibacter sp. 87.7]|uniref:preprotein translocase subunit SecD n=1 Tax=Methanobrevibacter sp. 87.7 TaxID=387957 RepID=UPI000B50EC9E|nr:preprotein translocase subunit SecD [Methanobrevibacter sp. 87.7]OWT32773.1 preprotein translocase subunit SecD [Methanobrevibacter sp. 87.7]